MENKSNSRDFAEYAEICRAAATLIRMSSNVILNVPVDEFGSSFVKSKKEFDSFIKKADGLSSFLFRAYNCYTKCASTLSKAEKRPSSAAPSGATVPSASKN